MNGACAGIAKAQDAQVVPSVSSSAPAPDLNAFLAERLSLWQKRLKLQDWRISVVLSRAAELKPKTLGNVHWDLPKKTATIHVLDPVDYRLPPKEMLADMEFTIVHELIHLDLAPVFSDLLRSDADRQEEEHAVNHMADALLNLDRGK